MKAPYPGAEPYWTKEEAEDLLSEYGLTADKFCSLMAQLEADTNTDMSDISWAMQEALK